MRRLEAKVAVVTGAASGIGAAMAARFVEEGARVVLCDRQGPRGKEVADSLGSQATFVEADVTDADQLAAVFEAATAWAGGLDVLCNNAGIAVSEGGIVDCPEEIFDRNIDVNLKAAWRGMKLAAPIMARRGGGSIVNTTSISGFRALPGQTGYGAAKAGLLHLTKIVASELAAVNIRVNSISPGGIVTPILYENPTMPKTDADAVRARLDSAQPLQRAGEAIDIANAAVFFASDESSFVTGQDLAVDGGKSIEFDTQLGRFAATALTRWAGQPS